MDEHESSASYGQQHAAYNQKRRSAIAAQIRNLRSAWLDPSLSDALRADLRKYVRRESERLLYGAPERLASRRDMLRLARRLRAWARDVDRHTNWDALWCGEQDALSDRLGEAWRDARYLRAYARSLKEA